MLGCMDTVACELTGGLVSPWPRKGGIRASCLFYKYNIIHKIDVCNWIPKKHATIVITELALLFY